MDVVVNTVRGKKGLEIGGPSGNFWNTGIYREIDNLDNVIFSLSTSWHQFAGKTYEFWPGKSGQVYEMDAVNLSVIGEGSYDILLSSHNLEHIANPLKALIEWKRVVKTNGGYIVLVLPEKSVCFDHKREYTKFDVLLDKYERDVGEDNLDSLPDILRNHDLYLDPAAGNFESFVKRSLDNVSNRCLHHHVFNKELVEQICEFLHMTLVHHHIDGLDMYFVIKL